MCNVIIGRRSCSRVEFGTVFECFSEVCHHSQLVIVKITIIARRSWILSRVEFETVFVCFSEVCHHSQ